MLIALSKNIVVYYCHGRGQTSLKMIKHDFLKIWEALKAKNLNAKFLIGKTLFLPPLKEQKTVFQYHAWFEPQA